MIRPLLAKNLKSSVIVTAIIFAVLTMYTTIIVSMFDPDLGDSLTLMAESMPELFAAFGMNNAFTTLFEFMVNYLYGFLYMVFPVVLILLLVNKLIVRHVEKGTFSCLLATPHRRASIISTQIVTLVLALLALVVAVTAMQIAACEALFPGEIEAGDLVLANVGLFGLWIFFAGICTVSACSFNRSGAALWVGGGVIIASILVQMISQVGDKLEDLKYLTPLTLYDAGGLVAGNSEAIAGTVVLYAVGIALAVAGGAIFCRRNLSV